MFTVCKHHILNTIRIWKSLITRIDTLNVLCHIKPLHTTFYQMNSHKFLHLYCAASCSTSRLMLDNSEHSTMHLLYTFLCTVHMWMCFKVSNFDWKTLTEQSLPSHTISPLRYWPSTSEITLHSRNDYNSPV